MGDRYEILARLGTGGFGTVYRARVHGAQGFQRDIALKLVEHSRADPEMMGRFRDEARLLGRIRHPNVPSVSPVLLLDAGWAVSMDLVPGVDCGRILKKLDGGFPPRVALQMVERVARTLEELHHWSELGEQSTLELLHRDIKPSNIMLTRHGKVVVLDFGSAWARFASRESVTTDHIGGTPGFIPPERLDGVESPAGDVFSLGVVLYTFLTAEKPPPLVQTEEQPPFEPPEHVADEVVPLLAFAHRMRSIHPKDRPTMTEVRRFCRDKAQTADGPDLKRWCGANIPEYAPRSADERVGSTLHVVEVEPKPFGIERNLLLGLLAAVGLLLLLVGMLLGIVLSPLQG